jgi:hypothetical protein
VSKLRDVAVARDRLARPFAVDHDASVRRKAAKPKDLLGWFLVGFRAEIPEQIHASGVFVGPPARAGEGLASLDPKTRAVLSTARELAGGSLIGTPRTADPFRAYLEGEADQVESARLTEAGVIVEEWAYRFPMRAALAALAGRGRDTDPYPFMARMLFRTASMDGDWNAACRSLGIIEPVRWPYVVAALERLWNRYEDEPPARFYSPRHRPPEGEALVAVV